MNWIRFGFYPVYLLLLLSSWTRAINMSTEIDWSSFPQRASTADDVRSIPRSILSSLQLAEGWNHVLPALLPGTSPVQAPPAAIDQGFPKSCRSILPNFQSFTRKFFHLIYINPGSPLSPLILHHLYPLPTHTPSPCFAQIHSPCHIPTQPCNPFNHS